MHTCFTERSHSALQTAALTRQVLGHSLAMVTLPWDAMCYVEVYIKQQGQLWELLFKCPSRSLSNNEAVLKAGHLLSVWFHITSQVAFLMDKRRSLLLALMNVKTGIRALKTGGHFWRAENEDACPVNTGAQGTAKLRPKALPSWCLH